MNNQPVMVMNQNARRETGSIARANNIAAAKAVSDIIRTTLGPRSMLKMILDASGGPFALSIDAHARGISSIVDLTRSPRVGLRKRSWRVRSMVWISR